MSAAVLGSLNILVNIVFNLIMLLIIVSVIISWVGADPYNPIVQTVRKLTEPLYKPFRPLSQKLNLPIDLSPIIVLLILTTLERIINQIIYQMSHGGGVG